MLLLHGTYGRLELSTLYSFLYPLNYICHPTICSMSSSVDHS